MNEHREVTRTPVPPAPPVDPATECLQYLLTAALALRAARPLAEAIAGRRLRGRICLTHGLNEPCKQCDSTGRPPAIVPPVLPYEVGDSLALVMQCVTRLQPHVHGVDVAAALAVTMNARSLEALAAFNASLVRAFP